MAETKLRVISLKALRCVFALFLIVSTVLFFCILKKCDVIGYTIQEEVNYTMLFFILIGLIMLASYNLYLSVFLQEEELEVLKNI